MTTGRLLKAASAVAIRQPGIHATTPDQWAEFYAAVNEANNISRLPVESMPLAERAEKWLLGGTSEENDVASLTAEFEAAIDADRDSYGPCRSGRHHCCKTLSDTADYLDPAAVADREKTAFNKGWNHACDSLMQVPSFSPEVVRRIETMKLEPLWLESP